MGVGVGHIGAWFCRRSIGPGPEVPFTVAASGTEAAQTQEA
jgi:hypothetical protein